MGAKTAVSDWLPQKPALRQGGQGRDFVWRVVPGSPLWGMRQRRKAAPRICGRASDRWGEGGWSFIPLGNWQVMENIHSWWSQAGQGRRGIYPPALVYCLSRATCGSQTHSISSRPHQSPCTNGRRGVSILRKWVAKDEDGHRQCLWQHTPDPTQLGHEKRDRLAPVPTSGLQLKLPTCRLHLSPPQPHIPQARLCSEDSDAAWGSSGSLLRQVALADSPWVSAVLLNQLGGRGVGEVALPLIQLPSFNIPPGMVTPSAGVLCHPAAPLPDSFSFYSACMFPFLHTEPWRASILTGPKAYLFSSVHFRQCWLWFWTSQVLLALPPLPRISVEVKSASPGYAMYCLCDP